MSSSSVFPNGLKQSLSIVRTLRSGHLPCRASQLITQRILLQKVRNTTYFVYIQGTDLQQPFDTSPGWSRQECT